MVRSSGKDVSLVLLDRRLLAWYGQLLHIEGCFVGNRHAPENLSWTHISGDFLDRRPSRLIPPFQLAHKAR